MKWHYCLCGCGVIARYRGLSPKCYAAALYQVKRGRTTWAKLESAGKAKPSTAANHKGPYRRLSTDRGSAE